jgi:hypothetical protein
VGSAERVGARALTGRGRPERIERRPVDTASGRARAEAEAAKESDTMVVGEAWELAIMFVLVLGNLALLVLLQRWFGLT